MKLKSYIIFGLFLIGFIISFYFARGRPILEMIPIMLLCYTPLTLAYIALNLKKKKSTALYLIRLNNLVSFVTDEKGHNNLQKTMKSRRPKFTTMNQFILANDKWTSLCTRWIHSKKISYIEVYEVETLEESKAHVNSEKISNHKENQKTDGIPSN